MHFLLATLAQAAIGKAADEVIAFLVGASKTQQQLLHDSVKQALSGFADLVEARLRESGATDDGIRQLKDSFSDFIGYKPVFTELARCFTELDPDFTPDHALLEREWKLKGLPELPASLTWQEVAGQFATEATKLRTRTEEFQKPEELNLLRTISAALVGMAKPKPELPVLVTWQEFYSGELERYTAHKFKSARTEKGSTTRPLNVISEFITGTRPVLVVHGSGGLGKSRLLVAAAEKLPNMRFVQTRLLGSDMPSLAEAIKSQAKPGDILVFDDCHAYRESVERLLGAARLAKARVIMATRYLEWVKPALQNCYVQPVELELGPVDNAAAIVPAKGDVAKRIAKLAQGNLMLAVMAYDHWKRHKNLTGIKDRFDLFSRITDDIAKTGVNLGVADARGLFAELAIRNGLWDTDEPLEKHKAIVTEVKTMGYITSEPRGERTLYRIYPDMLRDYMIQTTYVKSGELQSAFDALLQRLRPDDATNVIGVLAIEQKETADGIWKDAACGSLLDVMAKAAQAKSIGFAQQLGERGIELMVEIGVAAYDAFGDLKFVVDHLGDFCVGAEKLNSVLHLGMAGRASMQTGKLDRARACYERALRLAQASGNKEHQSMLFHQLAMLAQDRGDYPEARRLYTESLAISRELGNEPGIAPTLAQLAQIAASEGDYAEAERQNEESIKIRLAIGDKAGMAGNLHSSAILKRLQGDLAEARKLYKQSLAINTELGNKSGIGRTLHELALLAQVQGDYDKARELYSQSLAINRELGDKYGIAGTLHQIGNLARLRGDLTDARELYDQSLAIKQELGDKSGIALTQWGVAMIADAQGKPNEARKLYEEARGTFEELGDKKNLAGVIHQLANLVQAQGDNAKARKLYDQSLAIEQELGDKSGIAISLHQLAMLAQCQGDYPEARKLYDQSLAIKTKLGDKSGIASTLHQQAILAQSHGDLTEAHRLFEQSLTIQRELCDKYGIAGGLHQLGIIAYLQGDLAEAHRLHDEALAAFSELGAKPELGAVMGQHGRLAEAEKDDRTALRSYLMALAIFEELRSPNRDLAKQDIARMCGRLGDEAFKKLCDEVSAELQGPTATG